MLVIIDITPKRTSKVFKLDLLSFFINDIRIFDSIFVNYQIKFLGEDELSKLVKVAIWEGPVRGHVIFVHGLGGDAYDTWRFDKKDEYFWPRWLAEDNKHISTWTFSYEAPPVNWLGTSMSLHERATNFLAQILSEKELANGDIMFVCHSLGGLVAKQMLREADSQSSHALQAKSFVDRTKGIVFLATPHTGALLPTLADKLRLLVWPSNATFDLMKNNANLRNLNMWFRNWEKLVQCEIIYETKGTSFGTLVDPSSSDAGLPGVVPTPDDNDHIQIAKPISRDQLVYKKTSALLNSLMPSKKTRGTKKNTKINILKLPVLGKSNSKQFVPMLVRLILVLALLIGGFGVLTHLASPFWKNPVKNWVEVASEVRKKGIIRYNRPIPNEVSASRLEFEIWWNETPLSDKRSIDAKILFNALSYNIRIYRVSEKQSESKPNAIHWVNQSIIYFESIQNKYYLVESLIDKAAIYLELSQIEHTEPQSFSEIAADGDKIISRAVSLSSDDQKSTAMRIWSRFYYNLARPKGGKLHNNWSNDYLMIAYDKMIEAYDQNPDESKNASQLARVTQRLAANPPQDTQKKWTLRLRYVQTKLLDAWNKENNNLKTPEQRIPKLNVLATMTTDVIGREWRDLESKTTIEANKLLREIDEVALKSQREVMATIGQTEWEEDYDFDVHYDLGRIRSLKTQILLFTNVAGAKKEFSAVLENMKIAAQKASAIQAASAFSSVESNPNLSGLPIEYRNQIRQVFEIK